MPIAVEVWLLSDNTEFCCSFHDWGDASNMVEWMLKSYPNHRVEILVDREANNEG